ncbi:KAP family P-loop NTPase fold protein [Serratia marcescens]|uniref:KAP family P-loop NTPase fold protein n=1 Tax=Serratia marcescens TaxID=615 RepID=UPI0027E3CF7C|nr:P-loop NTPase fold protein [Serratia marcescens]MCS1373007.1 KAP family NTPase [Serratia marcescens]
MNIIINDDLSFNTRDEYNRKPIAEKIIEILNSEIPISPMMIDGSWGTGKTEFCFKLIKLFKESNPEKEIIYINAFNEDHTDEPILTLLASIVNLLPESERPSLIEKALPALRFGLKTTLKAGATWVLKQNTDELADEFSDAVQKTSDAAIDSTITSLIKDHVDSDKNIKALKSALTEISIKTPMCIFIDELDRCKPSFAVSILENIKHVFDVDNVKFVLITNTQQLQASINHIYGISLDAKRYLDKFIKFSFLLPETRILNSQEEILTSIEHWNYASGQHSLLNKIHEQVITGIKELIKKNRLSLREVETLARYIEVYQSLSKEGLGHGIILGYALYRMIGVYIYCFHREVALSISAGDIDTNSIASALNIVKLGYNTEEYPTYIELAFYGILKNYNSETFHSPNKATEEFLENFYNGLFRGDHYGVGNPIDIIKHAINTMQLK